MENMATNTDYNQDFAHSYFEEYDRYSYKSAEELTPAEIAEIKEKAEKSRIWIKENMGIDVPANYADV